MSLSEQTKNTSDRLRCVRRFSTGSHVTELTGKAAEQVQQSEVEQEIP